MPASINPGEMADLNRLTIVYTLLVQILMWRRNSCVFDIGLQMNKSCDQMNRKVLEVR